jgi:hypothetical protein
MKPALPLLLCGLAVGEQLSWARDAQACVKPAPVEFTLDPTLVGRDLEPPSAPRAVTALASRNSGMFCRGDRCTASTCGSEAYLQLEFEPALARDRSRGELGYRLRFREGVVPTELEGPLQRVFAGFSPLHVSLPEAFDAVVALDATFELVALDRAGNESAGSEPFRLAFDACTRMLDLGGCAEDSSPPVTCTAATGCVQAPLESDSGCALVPGRRVVGGSALGWVGIGLAGCALQLRRRLRAAQA